MNVEPRSGPAPADPAQTLQGQILQGQALQGQILQGQASDPRASAWVSANAGSGKTYVLARRVVRLLLAGTQPSKILCITFTKAAAAEMAKRVFDDLARWVGLGDAALAAELEQLEGRRPSREDIVTARRLFARALETPGGLKLQTIHAFCERLLHQFPFEANVAGHFEVLEENAATAMVAEARRKVLADAAAAPESELGRALRTVVAAASDRSHEGAIAEFVDKRERLEAWIVAKGSVDNAVTDLRRTLGLRPGDEPASIEARMLSESVFTPADFARLVRELAEGGVNDQKAAARLAPYLEAYDDFGRRAAYLAYMLTGAGSVRKPSGLATNKVKNFWAGLGENLDAEVARLEALLDHLKMARVFEQSAAMTRLADAVVGAYTRAKTGRGLLDFDDLVVKTKALLTRSDAARWVQYKLDWGLDHVLVDEAQDTSPPQWEVITALVDDFFAGAGARREVRTVFAVGDEKQSIYSFQGAVPAWFARVRGELAAKAGAVGQDLRRLELHVSRRSTPDILGAVDAIFAPPAAYAGLSSDNVAPVHEAHRRNQPGEVVIWPMLEDPPEAEPGAWHETREAGAAAPEAVLAERVAARIRRWLGDDARIAATGAPVKAGNVLILTRKRGALSEAINRALKRAGVPVAGMDRLALATHIAVMDLLALGGVMLLPEDDLTLATVLKGPLVGLSEDDLFRLAQGRAGSLWEALQKAGGESPFGAAFERLRGWRSRADYGSPYAFFARILGPEGGRKAFAARFGVETEDILDEFLAQALAYERTETPSLEGFLAWVRATATEIKRETELLRDEVRVMTVHGAKGLEADIVFVVDDGSTPAHSSHAPNIVEMKTDLDSEAAAPMVWVPGGRGLPDNLKAIQDLHQERAKQEYRRLFYVAATRARDRLYICGTRKKATSRDGGWHGLAEAALLATCRAVPDPDGGPDEYVWRSDWELAAAAPADMAKAAPDETPPPGWAERPPPAPRLLKALRPSRGVEDGETPGVQPTAALDARLPGRNDAMERGRLIHRLLEALPEQAAVHRRASAEHYLAAVAAAWPAAERAAVTDAVLAILANPQFAPVFAPGSRAEVAVSGTLAAGGGERLLSGRIDRLAVTAERVLIVDYKTNRPAPAALSEVPEVYLGQLALYRHVLAALYPGRAVEAALLWTDAPRLMAIPSDVLDEAARRSII